MATDFSKYGQSSVSGVASTAPSNSGTDFSKYGSPVAGIAKIDMESRTPGFIDKVSTDIKNRFAKSSATFKDFQSGNIDPLSTSLQILGQGAGAINDIAGQAVSSAYSSLPTFVTTPINETAKSVSTDILETSIGKAGLGAIKLGAEAYNKFKQENPIAAKNLEAVLNIGSLLPITKGATVASEGAVGAVKGATKGVLGTADNLLEKTLQSVTKPLSSSFDNVSKKVFEQTIDDWNKIGTDYVRTNKILKKAQAREKDPALFLAERGIDPGSTVDSGARKQIAERLKKQDTAPFEEVLQKSLQIADESAPGIDLNKIEANLLNDIKSANVDVQKAKTLEKGIKERIQLLKEKYGSDIVKRQDLNIEKRAFWQNTGFDTTGNLAGDVNYRMGRSLKTAIEDSVDDVNIQELNNILGDHYEAARFLEALDGKAGKLTTGEKIKKAIVRSASTLVGSKLSDFGGGLTGFIVADSINSALRGANDAFKSFFLQNLKTTNPAKYDEYVNALKYIQKTEVDKASRLKLPAPSPLGSPNNPIITPAPTTYEKPAAKINIKR